jgi:hypothetical protein
MQSGQQITGGATTLEHGTAPGTVILKMPQQLTVKGSEHHRLFGIVLRDPIKVLLPF